MNKLTKQQKLKRLNYIRNNQNFITCEQGHIYLPISEEAKIICPICYIDVDTDLWDKYLDDIDEKYLTCKYINKDIYYED